MTNTVSSARDQATDPGAPSDSAGHDIYIKAAVALLGIPVDPAWMTSIDSNFAAILKHAAFVEAFPLSDELEPAPVFSA